MPARSITFVHILVFQDNNHTGIAVSVEIALQGQVADFDCGIKKRLFPDMSASALLFGGKLVEAVNSFLQARVSRKEIGFFLFKCKWRSIQ